MMIIIEIHIDQLDDYSASSTALADRKDASTWRENLSKLFEKFLNRFKNESNEE